MTGTHLPAHRRDFDLSPRVYRPGERRYACKKSSELTHKEIIDTADELDRILAKLRLALLSAKGIHAGEKIWQNPDVDAVANWLLQAIYALEAVCDDLSLEEELG